MSERNKILSQIQGHEKHIEIHRNKIRNEPEHSRTISYWEKEIRTAQDNIAKLRDKLYYIPQDAYCYTCRKDVAPKNNKCPKCKQVL